MIMVFPTGSIEEYREPSRLFVRGLAVDYLIRFGISRRTMDIARCLEEEARKKATLEVRKLAFGREDNGQTIKS